MAYVYALDVALPANTDLVSQGAQNIRELKAAVRERINSFFVNVDTDPLAGKDGAVLGNTTVKALTPVADNTYALGTAAFRFSDLRVNTATFSGNVSVGGTFGATGAATFSSTLAVGAITGTANVPIDVLTNATSLLAAQFRMRTANDFSVLRFTATDGTENVASIVGARTGAGTGHLYFESSGTERLRIASGGQVLIGTTVTTGAAAGELVLANAKALRGVNAAGTGTNPLISADSVGYVQVGSTNFDSPIKIAYLAAASLGGAGANANGALAVDSTNDRLIYYSGGAKYYLTGTAF